VRRSPRLTNALQCSGGGGDPETPGWRSRAGDLLHGVVSPVDNLVRSRRQVRHLDRSGQRLAPQRKAFEGLTAPQTVRTDLGYPVDFGRLAVEWAIIAALYGAFWLLQSWPATARAVSPFRRSRPRNRRPRLPQEYGKNDIETPASSFSGISNEICEISGGDGDDHLSGFGEACPCGSRQCLRRRVPARI
jgi:hypothetical protein